MKTTRQYSKMPYAKKALMIVVTGIAGLALTACNSTASMTTPTQQQVQKTKHQSIGYQTTASGLKYRVLAAGSGMSPSASDTVTVHYEGRLTNGQVFDSSYQRGQPATFPLNGVIKGWTEGLQLMQEGGKYEFYIPAKLAYGSRSVGSIPANSPLIFTVELIKVQ